MAEFHRFYGPLMPGVERIARPHCYRCELDKTFPDCRLACADELERKIETVGADKIAAMIVEPIQGVGGVVVPPAGYHQRIREICDQYEILMVVDEVIFSDVAPWPAATDDGQGNALHRVFTDATHSGNDPANWRSGPPAPGQ